jgi:hypothetical protein
MNVNANLVASNIGNSVLVGDAGAVYDTDVAQIIIGSYDMKNTPKHRPKFNGPIKTEVEGFPAYLVQWSEIKTPELQMCKSCRYKIVNVVVSMGKLPDDFVINFNVTATASNQTFQTGNGSALVNIAIGEVTGTMVGVLSTLEKPSTFSPRGASAQVSEFALSYSNFMTNLYSTRCTQGDVTCNTGINYINSPGDPDGADSAVGTFTSNFAVAACAALDAIADAAPSSQQLNDINIKFMYTVKELPGGLDVTWLQWLLLSMLIVTIAIQPTVSWKYRPVGHQQVVEGTIGIIGNIKIAATGIKYTDSKLDGACLASIMYTKQKLGKTTVCFGATGNKCMFYVEDEIAVGSLSAGQKYV